MNNESNNVSGTVLGSVDNQTVNPNPGNQVGLGDVVIGASPATPEPTNTNNANPVLDSGNSVVMPSNPAPAENQVISNNPVPNPTPQVVNNPVNNNLENNNQVLSGNEIVTPQPAPVNNPAGVQPQVQPTPVANPTPAPAAPGTNYTNPQAINPTPMPGFEASGTVGTTPPISLEATKKPKKPTNKIAFIIIIVGLLALVGIGTYYVLNNPGLFSKNAKITIETKSLEINLGDALPNDMASFASVSGTELTNCSKDVSTVDVTKAGTYSFTIKCGDSEKVGTVTIVDNTELVVATRTVYKTVGDTTIEASEFAGNNTANLTFEFANASDVTAHLNAPGTYQVDLNVKDSNGKTAAVKGTLIVLEYKIKGHLVCNSNPQNVTGTNISMIVSGSYGIADADGNIFGKSAVETYTFTFSDETEYQKYVDEYNNNHTITINNIVGNVNNLTFDDANHIISITNDLGETDINNKYGANNFATYSSIKNYFQGIGYTCSYQN